MGKVVAPAWRPFRPRCSSDCRPKRWTPRPRRQLVTGLLCPPARHWGPCQSSTPRRFRTPGAASSVPPPLSNWARQPTPPRRAAAVAPGDGPRRAAAPAEASTAGSALEASVATADSAVTVPAAASVPAVAWEVHTGEPSRESCQAMPPGTSRPLMQRAQTPLCAAHERRANGQLLSGSTRRTLGPALPGARVPLHSGIAPQARVNKAVGPLAASSGGASMAMVTAAARPLRVLQPQPQPQPQSQPCMSSNLHCTSGVGNRSVDLNKMVTQGHPLIRLP
mmetsp:Transcript_115738/g.322402  ORF Transcript_115738/g.322402 Transcript_115738/m.322402 type:complete len:279 (+) Transcript_115738:942-1778(+)